MAKWWPFGAKAKDAHARVETPALPAPPLPVRRAARDSYVNLAANLGVTAPNLSNASTYDLNPITRQRMLLDWMYRGSWVIGVAVDAYAEDMTREGVTWLGDTDPDDLEKLDGALTDLGLW
jgi:hypothetical protein